MVPQTVVGWDLGKVSSYVTATNRDTGEIIREGKVPNTPGDIRAAVEGLPRPIRVVFEATGNWQATYELLEGHVEEMQMAHPLETKAIAHARIKTDKIDAATLAHLGRADLVPQSWIPPREVRDLREILRHRAFLVSLQTKVKNRIYTYLDKVGMAYPDVADMFGKGGMAFLRSVEIREPYRFLMNRDLNVYERLHGEIEEVSAKIRAMAQEDPRAKFILPMRGLGPFSVMLILSEIGDIGRFPAPEQLVSYAGLCPATYQSGKSIRHGSITKRGSKWLRWILIEATIHYTRAGGRLGLFYQRMLRRKGVKVARVALARELLHSIFWCLKKGVVFKEVFARGR
jgi:transposase